MDDRQLSNAEFAAKRARQSWWAGGTAAVVLLSPAWLMRSTTKTLKVVLGVTIATGVLQLMVLLLAHL